MRRLAIALLVVVVLVGLAVWWISGRGFSARETPSALEAEIAQRVRGLAIPRGAKDKKNPVPVTTDSVRMGMAHFADHCAICHGNDGHAKTTIGEGLYPKPPNLTEQDTQGLTDGELYYIITNGIRFTGMPGFGDHEADENWHLVNFIRHLPRITAGELQQMEALNPKGPDERKEEREEQEFLEGGKKH